MATGLIIMFSALLPVISAFKFIGVLILTVYRMLTGDIFRFLVVYIILLYGFSAAMYMLMPADTYEARLDPKCAHADFHGLDNSTIKVSPHICDLLHVKAMLVCTLGCDQMRFLCECMPCIFMYM